VIVKKKLTGILNCYKGEFAEKAYHLMYLRTDGLG
jgi:hypothetical protein